MWLRWPEEMESSLLAAYGERADIRHWHRLTLDECGTPILSSRRLLALLDELPESSRFKTGAERAGRQSRAERVSELTFNEIASLRASFHAVHGGSAAAYEPLQLMDPIDWRAHLASAHSEEAEQEQAISDFESEIGFT